MSISVMPDLIRYPETFENTRFRLSPERRFFRKTVVYGQTLHNLDSQVFSTADKLLCSKSPDFIGALRRLFKTPVDRRFWTWFLFSLTLFVKVATPRNSGKDNVLASTVSLLMN